MLIYLLECVLDNHFSTLYMRLQKKRHEMEAAAAKEKARKEQVGHLNEDTFFNCFSSGQCIVS